MTIRPEQPQSIGEVLDTTFRLFKASFGSVWFLCLLSSIASNLPALYLLFTGSVNSIQDIAAAQGATYFLLALVGAILTVWLVAAVYLREGAIGSEESLSATAALQMALQRLLPLVALIICLVVALLVGYILLVIPGIILTVSLMLSTMLLLFEEKGPIASLTGSHRLVWGSWWRTAAIMTIGFLILLVIYFAVALVIGLMAPFVGVGDPLLFAWFSTVVIGALVGVFGTPFYVALLIAIYWDLKLRKEGGDLAARVGALGTA